ncbi:hypothetical protein M422DRAFT_227907 [Sphaerobolus stellatus SS14]|uniref:RecA family profile 1 domain-containing protein n=1 Tax=Sphaerobolus stellatus (strain SS14) TaxID=990650 RepID=A0A0C9W147_SPHS4|nr:hypothetical protein M422DRAFT_227907 [Sphaerobolus stellatus SS14]
MQRLDHRSTSSGFFTVGDPNIDELFGGGLLLGGINEFVGESGSGKTQLALQTCLTVQLPPDKGGCSGSACFLTTSGVLPTPRLLQLTQEHPLLKSHDCNLSNVHTRSISSPAELSRTLQGIPLLVQQISAAETSSSRLKLLVLDSLAGVFRMAGKTTSETLMERSRELNEISALLHGLASTYNLAVLVINEVNASVNREHLSEAKPPEDYIRDIYYAEQARWFSRGSSLPSEQNFEANLGLVWASQVGLRVMMTRTGRRRFPFDGNNRSKRSAMKDAELDESNENDAILIRRLSIIFSCCSPPSAIDYVVTKAGVCSVGDI